MMFGFYIRNNVGVAFQCFAGGLFAGLGTLFFLAYNGAFSGALAGYLTERGLSYTFYSFIATHSAFELTAIVLSGAAGLRIGHALLAPGRLTRLQSLVQATRDSAVLLYGVTAHAARRRRHRGLLVVRDLAPRGRQVRQRRCLLDRRARVFRLSGTTCRLTRSPCACGRGLAMEAADLGVRLCQSAAHSVYRSYGLVALPVAALARGLVRARQLAAGLVLWCAKPWLDRTILFVLSRAAFGQPTAPSDVWKAQRQVWWSQLLFTWTVRRLSLWRSFTQPVYQLEGVSIRTAGARVRQLRQRSMGSALMIDAGVQLVRNGADAWRWSRSCSGLRRRARRRACSKCSPARSGLPVVGRPGRLRGRRCCFSSRSTWRRGSRCT